MPYTLLPLIGATIAIVSWTKNNYRVSKAEELISFFTIMWLCISVVVHAFIDVILCYASCGYLPACCHSSCVMNSWVFTSCPDLASDKWYIISWCKPAVIGWPDWCESLTTNKFKKTNKLLLFKLTSLHFNQLLWPSSRLNELPSKVPVAGWNVG